MKEIALNRPTDVWRGKPRTTQPWPEIVSYWQDWVKDQPFREPLCRLVAALASSPVSSSLFGSITWHGIAISDTIDFRSTDNTLEIDLLTREGQFEFRHRAFSGHDDRKMVPASEALETLRQFLKYKYGLLFEPPAV